MPTAFAPRLDILPGPQLRLWRELIAVPKEFTLYGGTAIALQLGHRQSIDFDFFGSKRFDSETLTDRIGFLEDAEILQREASTITYLVDRDGPVKLSFFGVPDIGQVDRPLVAPDIGLRVASLRDLAGMKVSVVQVRSEAKDYLDLAALIEHGIDLVTALAAGTAIYGQQFNPQITLKALAYFGDGDLPSLPAKVKRLLRDRVRAADLDELPQIKPARPHKSARRKQRPMS